MTVKYLRGDYPGGYALSGAYTRLMVTSSASIGGSGVSAYFKASVTNDGTIQATGGYGVYLRWAEPSPTGLVRTRRR